jgi:hypothetical protein
MAKSRSPSQSPQTDEPPENRPKGISLRKSPGRLAPAKKPRTRSHPTLGLFTFDAAYDWWAGRVELGPGHTIDYRLSTWGDHNFEASELMDRGASFLAWARSSEKAALTWIADTLHSVYLAHWQPEERTRKRPMSRKTFLSHVTTSSINLNADGSAYWYFNDGGLFAGHTIEVRVRPDKSISEVCLAG